MKKKKVFVSGCYDVLHAGHIQFFEDAKALGDHLTVCFASNAVLKLAKGRPGSLPEDHKKKIIGSLKCVDVAVPSSDLDTIFDFKKHILKEKHDILAVTEDDKYGREKKEFCKKNGIKFVVLPKRNSLTSLSTTKILAGIKNSSKVPLRVDFAGGWLDVPKFSRPDGWIVNCAIQPLVSLEKWPYEIGGGLGGSAARAMLEIRDGVVSELKLGVGWQDPAIISETGICVWRSGKKPVLDLKSNPDWLEGKMLILWQGKPHNTPGLVDNRRDYGKIQKASKIARQAVIEQDIPLIAEAINMSYEIQLDEGMEKLPANTELKKAIAKKYLGGGWGGYALYLFNDKKERDLAAKQNRFAKKIEPFIK